MAFPDSLVALLFRFALPSVVFAMQYMLYRKLYRWWGERFPVRHRMRTWLAAPFIVFNLALLLVTVLRPGFAGIPPWLKYGVAYPFFIWHASTFFIALILIVGTLLSLPVRLPVLIGRMVRRWKSRRAGLPEPAPAVISSRREFIRKSMYGLTAVSFAGSSYGVVYGRTRCEINRTDIHIPHLPSGLEGFTIGLISDIHSSAFMPVDDMKRYVGFMNSLGADMIAVTGDFVNSKVAEVYPFAEAFSELHAPEGVFGVLGNHDYFTRNVDLVARVVDACGVRILRNDAVVLRQNGARLLLAGLDDISRPASASTAMEASLRGTPDAIPRVLLCHRPYFLPQAAEKKFDLVLSGHTHGGQISLGTVGNTALAPAALASPYVWGNYHAGTTQMYVNRGIGTVGLPIRLNCPPELTVVRLTGGSPVAARLDRVVTIS